MDHAVSKRNDVRRVVSTDEFDASLETAWVRPDPERYDHPKGATTYERHTHLRRLALFVRGLEDLTDDEAVRVIGHLGEIAAAVKAARDGAPTAEEVVDAAVKAARGADGCRFAVGCHVRVIHGPPVDPRFGRCRVCPLR